MPVVHATREDVAWTIGKLGFATVGAVDSGLVWERFDCLNLFHYVIGAGVYFTTFPEYAAFSYCINPSESVFIISYLLPGNGYPLAERPHGTRTLRGTKLNVRPFCRPSLTT